MGLSYAAVPLYQAFCQVTGYGGTVKTIEAKKLEELSSISNNEHGCLWMLTISGEKGKRTLIIKFDAGTGIGLPWKFKPLQNRVQLVTGETALAFYNAENSTNHPMTGVATYNVTPMKVKVCLDYISSLNLCYFPSLTLAFSYLISTPIPHPKHSHAKAVHTRDLSP
eukprot:803235-Amorphochlora_amoeboformis.AAC.1